MRLQIVAYAFVAQQLSYNELNRRLERKAHDLPVRVALTQRPSPPAY